ncbi:hypothetical protein THAOC_35495 [Thalassiosira oceanica]|uniref:Uncharacterized protein n=1 Tax=Thalassiosira oceanica TaxID=159749 RepID=K0R3A0_THAOC|nr:hypothetical protein THAOC_35495 [Thalassiosira oceanica]|eukprot:EJK45869.1 hypothetical protein THAOC_35495 [Thalassiosira oceanica]
MVTLQKNRDTKADAERAKNKAYFLLLELLTGGKTNSSGASRGETKQTNRLSSPHGSAHPQTLTMQLKPIQTRKISRQTRFDVARWPIHALVVATNVEANLDFSEEEAKKMGCDDLPDDKGGGVQQDYLEKLVEQLRLELNCSTKTKEPQWLLSHLRDNDYARRIAKFLKALY